MKKEIRDRQFNRILVVDDTTGNLQLLTNLLTANGYTVYPASDGKLALEFVQSILPDLILLDIRMPEMDGYEVCHRLKSDKRTRSIPIIIISALENEDDKIMGFQAGAVDYITKPFRTEEVLARVRIHLQLRELTEHLEQKVAERTEELYAANAQLQHEFAERMLAEKERQANLKFFESMDQINRAIQGTNNLEQMMSDVLDVVLSVFDCDRASLVYPCDPEAQSWTAPMERFREPYKGVLALGLQVPMNDEVAWCHRLLLTSDGPVPFGLEYENQMPAGVGKRFHIRSQLGMAIYPRIDSPWMFVIHQCSRSLLWNESDIRLFQEIGRRLAEALTSLSTYRVLQESEQRYRMVFENSPVSIWEEDFSGVKNLFDSLRKKGITDIETYFGQHPEIVRQCADLIKIVDVNHAAVELHKAENKEELIASLVSTFMPESFNIFRLELICLWNGYKEMISDAVVKTLAGEPRNVTVYFSVCPGYEETLSKVIVSLIDITERKQVEEKIRKFGEKLEILVNERTAELKKANERLKELDRLKSMFIASMSHELRTPLNSIIGFSSILLNEWAGTVNPAQKENLTTILRSGKHLLSLINDVIDVSKIESGNIESSFEDIDLYDVMNEAVNTFELDIKKKGKELKVSSIHQIIYTDRRRLLQCMYNLISNAIKFTENGVINVWAEIAHDGNTVEISVSDTGIGIREEDIHELFTAFKRLDSPFRSTILGTGLGLYLTKKITIEILKGNITVKSAYGKGSRFTLTLPLSELRRHDA